MKLLAIDIGASGGRAVLGDFSTPQLRLSEVYRFPNSFVEVRGHKHWDILRLLRETKECLRRAGPDVVSMGIDTWGVDYGYVGADGDLMGLPFAYRDARTANAIERVHEKIPVSKLYSITGIQHLPFNTIYQIADDVAARPWLVERSHKLLMMPELLSYLLTGECVAEYTNASTTALLDASKRCWSDEVLETIGFPGDRLARIVQPGEVQVPLAREIAQETGSQTRLVYPACHDTGSAVAAVPAQGEDWVYISSGTWSLMGMELPTPILTEEASAHNFTNEGGVAGTIRFLSNVMGLWIIQELRRGWVREDRDLGFSIICGKAEAAPAFGSLINPDHPSFMAPDDMGEAIANFCQHTGQPVPEGVGPLARCVFESLALAYARVLGQLRDVTGRTVERLYVVGGGSQNALLCQMTADACQLPLSAGPAEATALGNLLMQAIVQGDLSNMLQGRRLIAFSFPPVEYFPAQAERWEETTDRFERLTRTA